MRRAGFRTFAERAETPEDLGLALAPGAAHYRAYVGPPGDYDLIAAMTFNLLTTLGLRQHHALLDIGCGSLRLGRLLIPYLNRGKYVAIEPNEWLVRAGIANETGDDQIRIKGARIHIAASAERLPSERFLDFAVAQSIFSHCGPELVREWMESVSSRLREDGVLVATWVDGEADSSIEGWVYPECVPYTQRRMADLARQSSLELVPIDWAHPRQKWGLFRKPGFKVEWIRAYGLSWNSRCQSEAGGVGTSG